MFLSKTNIQFIDLTTQQELIRDQIDARMRTVLNHGQYIMGPEVTELEQKLAQYVGVDHCIAVANGTDALMVAMIALGIGPGDEVITTPFTFIATAEMIARVGAQPVFVDIDPKTYNIAPEKIEAAITSRTKAIMPVSLYGQCADFDQINAIADQYDLWVIEDGAQSFGATYHGRKSGSLSTIGTTSFFPSKPLGCYGDGGACFTDDAELALRMRWIRSHGQDRRYHHQVIGVNSRLDTLQAAILLAKFDIFPEELNARLQIGSRYTEKLSNSVKTPWIAPHNTSVYAQYTIQVENREELQKHLNQAGIPTAVHYPIPLHMQPAFSFLRQPAGSFPIAEAASDKVMSLPMHPYLKPETQDWIMDQIQLFLRSK